jgi:hypothetical protein
MALSGPNARQSGGIARGPAGSGGDVRPVKRGRDIVDRKKGPSDGPSFLFSLSDLPDYWEGVLRDGVRSVNRDSRRNREIRDGRFGAPAGGRGEGAVWRARWRV